MRVWGNQSRITPSLSLLSGVQSLGVRKLLIKFLSSTTALYFLPSHGNHEIGRDSFHFADEETESP